MNWQKRLYFGTWQFGGDFRKWNDLEIKHLISYALARGIKKFDTAAVYGAGNVERILGCILPDEAAVVTKIAASSKPTLSSNNSIDKYYSEESIRGGVEKSLERLRRATVDTILLHNWIPAWNTSGLNILRVMNDLKKSGLTKRIGISFPDGFGAQLPMPVVRRIDVIEAPFNFRDRWILSQLPVLKQAGKEIILRSIFIQGLLTRDQDERRQFPPYDCRSSKTDKISTEIKQDPHELVRQAWALGTSVAIGMTTEEQIEKNLATLKGG